MKTLTSHNALSAFGGHQLPDYVVTHYYLDANGGETLKQYEGEFADYATARGAADDLLVDAQAITDAHLYRETLAETTDIAGSSAATSNVFERISATVELDTAGKKYNLVVPSPAVLTPNPLFSGNALVVTQADWVAYIANFGTGLWTVSDGEHITGTIRGKRQFVRSGRTNLPV